MKKTLRYTCLCCKGRAVVVSTDQIKDFHEVKDDSAFLCKVGHSNICTQFFYQNNDLEAVKKFADNVNKEFTQQRLRREQLMGMKGSCPDSL